MISINKQGNAIVIEFTDNDKYLFNGKIEVAPNELIVVVDQSDMVTFKRASNGDVLFSQLVDDIQIAGSPVTKDTVIDQFAIIGFTSGGGGGTGGAVSSVNGQTGDVIITPASLNVYTRAEVDDAINAETTERQKQDSALGGMIAAETAAREQAVASKQDTLVSGQNIKTINGESILGEGNIAIQGGGSGISDAPSDNKLYGRKNANWSEIIIPSTDNLATKEELNAKANLDGANFTGGVVVPDLSINNPTKGVMFNVSNQSNDILFRTLNAGIDSISFQVQNAYPLKLTEAGIMENNQLLENKYAKIDDIPTNVSDLENDSGFITNTEASNSYQAKGDYATKAELASKQDTLVSGTNIKTVNGQSLLGNGNIEIQGGELPIASADTLGGIKVGAGLSINPGTGVLSATGGGTADSVEWDNVLSKPDDIVNITERLAAKLDTATYNSEKANFATKEELNSKADTSALSAKQDTLVSGTNIKTINGETILGEGDLTISSESRTWRFTCSSSITTSDSATITPDGFNSQEWLGQVAIGDMVYIDKGLEFMKLSVSNIYHPTTGNIKVGLSFYSDRLYWVLVVGNVFTLNIHSVPSGETNSATALGQQAAVTASGSYGVAIGNNTKSNGYNAIVIGNNIQEDEQLSINIGDYLKVSYSNGFSYWDGTQMQSLKNQLATLAPPTVDTEMSDTSENAVQNKVIKKYIDDLVGNILTQLQEINGTN